MIAGVWFDEWGNLGRVVVVGVVAYLALIVVLRVSGKRVLSKMNAFDLVVTVALGSTFATILLSKDVALAEGIAALFLLVALQYTVTWLSVRSAPINRLVKSEPTLLYRGGYLESEMRRARVVREEILAAVRSQGISSMEEVSFVVLETDGSFTVLPTSSGPRTALGNLDLERCMEK